MEENTFEEQVHFISRAKVAIGLHGSILILGMFLPPVIYLLKVLFILNSRLIFF